MSDTSFAKLKRCDDCETINNSFVNDRCYRCGGSLVATKDSEQSVSERVLELIDAVIDAQDGDAGDE